MPAAAVIPAPIAYIKVVAVKKLVVGFRDRAGWSAARRVLLAGLSFLRTDPRVLLTECAVGTCDVYFEKIRVFKAGPSQPEYISME